MAADKPHQLYMKKPTEHHHLCRVTTPKGRLSYPFIFEPSEGDDGKKKYRCQLLVPKQNKNGEDIDYKKIHTAIRNCKTIVWGKDKTKWPKKIANPIRDGDTDEGFQMEKKLKSGKTVMVPRPEYKGMWVISASSNEQSKPVVVDRDEEIIDSPADVYPGCYARLSLMAQEWTYMKKTGIMFVLDGVQKLADGEPFGDKKNPKDMFKEALSDEDLEDIEELEGDEDDEDSDDDEDEAPKSKKKKRPVDDDEDEDDSDDEEDSDEDLDDEDSDDDDEDEEEPPRKKKASSKKKRPVDDDEDDDDDE